MGGFAIQSQFLDPRYPTTGQWRLTLTKEGVTWLLQTAPEIFPNLTEDEILDKSKASTLVKTLTCLQAFWFCLQVIVRLTMNTSIGLLELNVFAHCICTFIIYAIWWNKPMDISEPTLLRVSDKPEFQSLIAMLCSYGPRKPLSAPREMPLSPSPLDECVLRAGEYLYSANPRDIEPCELVSLTPRHHSCGRRYCPSEQRNLQIAHDDDELNTRFDATDCSHPDTRSANGDVSLDLQHSHRTLSSPPNCVMAEDRYYLRERGPRGYDDEEEVNECAGLRIERLVQLLSLYDSDPQM